MASTGPWLWMHRSYKRALYAAIEKPRICVNYGRAHNPDHFCDISHQHHLRHSLKQRSILSADVAVLVI